MELNQAISSTAGDPSFLYSMAILAGIGGFLFGYDTGTISSAMIVIREKFVLNSVWQELIVSLTTLTAAIAALVGGTMNHFVGRKPVILAGGLIYVIGVLCQALAKRTDVFFAGRCIIGFSMGLESTTVPIYIAEAAPAHLRGRLVSIHIAMTAFGQFVATISWGGLSKADNGWRILMGIGALPAVVQVFGFFLMPESPRWLIRKGKLDQAIEVLEKCRGGASVNEEFVNIKTLVEEAERDRGNKYLILCQMFQIPSVRRALILGCGLQMFQQLAGINTVMYYSTSIIRMAGVKSQQAQTWLSSVTTGMTTIFTVIGLILVEKIGRRPLILISIGGALGALIWLALGFQMAAMYSPLVTLHETANRGSSCDTYKTCDQCMLDLYCGFCFVDKPMGPINGSCLRTNYDDTFQSIVGRCNVTTPPEDTIWAYDFCPTKYYWMPMLGLITYLLFFAPGMGPMPWTINTEIYPLWARSTGNAVSTFTNWLFALIVSMSFLTLTENITRHGTFWVYAAITVFGGLFVYFLLPETKGKKLEEVEGLFARPWFSMSKPSALNCNSEKSVQYLHIRGFSSYDYDMHGSSSEDDDACSDTTH